MFTNVSSEHIEIKVLRTADHPSQLLSGLHDGSLRQPGGLRQQLFAALGRKGDFFALKVVLNGFGMGFQAGSKLFEHGNTLIQRACRPGWECCASSLHARIIADAFARRALSLVGGAPQAAKLHAWLDTWYAPQRHHLAAPGNLRALTHSVLDDALAEREGQAVRLADLAETAARAAFARLFDPIDPEDKTP